MLYLSVKGREIARTAPTTEGVMLLSVPHKVFARIIIERVRHHLLEHQHPEQSSFTPKRSTIDRVLALRFLTEHRR